MKHKHNSCEKEKVSLWLMHTYWSWKAPPMLLCATTTLYFWIRSLCGTGEWKLKFLGDSHFLQTFTVWKTQFSHTSSLIKSLNPCCAAVWLETEKLLNV